MVKGNFCFKVYFWCRVEYKIYGSDGLFNYDFVEDEVVELEKMDWNLLIFNLGLKIYECWKFCKFSYVFVYKNFLVYLIGEFIVLCMFILIFNFFEFKVYVGFV